MNTTFPKPESMSSEERAKADLANSPEVTENEDKVKAQASASSSAKDSASSGSATPDPHDDFSDQVDAQSIADSVDMILKSVFGEDNGLTAGQTMGLRRVFQGWLPEMGKMPRRIIILLLILSPWIYKAVKSGLIKGLFKRMGSASDNNKEGEAHA